jgi:hypothetical protein
MEGICLFPYCTKRSGEGFFGGASIGKTTAADGDEHWIPAPEGSKP